MARPTEAQKYEEARFRDSLRRRKTLRRDIRNGLIWLAIIVASLIYRHTLGGM